MLGTKQPAEDGKLTVVVSGAAGALDRARPAFDAVGGRPLEAIQGGPTDSAYALAKGAAVARCSWDEPAFALDSVVKDVGLMLDAARESGFPGELLATLLALYDRAAERGLGGADMAAVRAAFDR